MSNTIMELSNIQKNFGGIRALKGVDFKLRKGEVHALLGENGAGKSTLIKIITGVYEADEGQIILNGQATVIRNPIDARKKGIAAIYQELSLIESLTVAENIFLGNEPTITSLGIYDRKLLYSKSQEYLERFGIEIDYHKKVSELGMGQKRIIEIVKALAVNSQILLLDEPTTGMSNAEIDMLFKIIENLKNNNVTMIYISHYLEEVFKVCDRATVFRDGQNVDTFEVDKVTPSQLVKSMIGREIRNKNQYIPKDFTGKETILELKNLKTNLMQEPVSLTVKKSEILGITGIVGSGKSELAYSIFGNAQIESGEIYVKGKKAAIKNPRDSKKYKIAFVPEDRKSEGLFLSDTIADNIVVSNIEQIQNKFGLLNRKRKNIISQEIGKKLNVNPLNVDMPVKNLSGGNQQKVVIAKWLIGNPEIILMDEPTRGIDVGAKSEIYNLIKDLSTKDKGIVVMSSEFKEIIDLCDRILVLRKGSVVGELSPNEATSEKLLSLSLGG